MEAVHHPDHQRQTPGNATESAVTQAPGHRQRRPHGRRYRVRV